ncbi:MAG: hypothetical protein IJC25_07710 [Clostridia bacterium]|nr:hypothetical protein [Clostridia bacterium]
MANCPIYREDDSHATEYRNSDEALMPATVLHRPGGIYNDGRRKWQGIPGIERPRRHSAQSGAFAARRR